MRRKGSRGRPRKTGRGRRKCKASAAADFASDKWVTIGAKVEVRSDEDGFVGAWFAAQVVHLESPSSCVVEYDQLLADDAFYPLQEIVPLQNVRPCPPRLPVFRSWLPGHLVEAYDRDGWWAGIVVCSDSDRDLVLVCFRTTGKELNFPPSLIRGLQNWDNGKWTDLTQVGQPDTYHVGNAVDANGCSSPSHMPDTRKRGRSGQREQLSTDFPIHAQMEAEQSDDVDSEQFGDVNVRKSPVKDLNPHEESNIYALCDAEKLQVLRTNGYFAAGFWSHRAELVKSKTRLELVAYQLLTEALHRKGPLKWEHERLLSDVRFHLNITSEEQTFVLNRFMPPKVGRQ